jgi:hypothetical protein
LSVFFKAKHIGKDVKNKLKINTKHGVYHSSAIKWVDNSPFSWGIQDVSECFGFGHKN